MGWIYVGHNSGQWWGIVNTAMNLQSFVKVGKSLDYKSHCHFVAIILPHDDNTF